MLLLQPSAPLPVLTPWLQAAVPAEPLLRHKFWGSAMYIRLKLGHRWRNFPLLALLCCRRWLSRCRITPMSTSGRSSPRQGGLHFQTKIPGDPHPGNWGPDQGRQPPIAACVARPGLAGPGLRSCLLPQLNMLFWRAQNAPIQSVGLSPSKRTPATGALQGPCCSVRRDLRRRLHGDKGRASSSLAGSSNALSTMPWQPPRTCSSQPALAYSTLLAAYLRPTLRGPARALGRAGV